MIIKNTTNMKKLILILPALVMSLIVLAAPKPQRVVVVGDDPMMSSDEAAGSVGYTTALHELFDDAVTVEVQSSSVLLPDDPAVLLEPTAKGDIVLICKLHVEARGDDRVQSDIYLEQLQAIQKAAQKRGVKLIWLNQGCPRYFTADSVQVHRLGIFPETVRRFCKRDALPFVDVEMLMFDWLTAKGVEASAAMFVPVQVSNPALEEKAAREGSLLTEQGAHEVATLIGAAIRADKKNPLHKRLR